MNIKIRGQSSKSSSNDIRLIINYYFYKFHDSLTKYFYTYVKLSSKRADIAYLIIFINIFWGFWLDSYNWM